MTVVTLRNLHGPSALLVAMITFDVLLLLFTLLEGYIALKLD